MPDKNNNNTLWVVGFIVGLGVLLWLVTQCSLTCASSQKESWGGTHVQAGRRPVGGIPPVRGDVNPSFFDIKEASLTSCSLDLCRVSKYLAATGPEY